MPCNHSCSVIPLALGDTGCDVGAGVMMPMEIEMGCAVDKEDEHNQSKNEHNHCAAEYDGDKMQLQELEERAQLMFLSNNGAPGLSDKPPLADAATLGLLKLAKRAVAELNISNNAACCCTHVPHAAIIFPPMLQATESQYICGVTSQLSFFTMRLFGVSGVC